MTRSIEEVGEGYRLVAEEVSKLWRERGWEKYGYVLMMIDGDHLQERAQEHNMDSVQPAMATNMGDREAVMGFMMKVIHDLQREGGLVNKEMFPGGEA